MASSEMSFWIKFFKEAGIPAGDAANYAVTFTDHRIVRAMLLDLNKEYLNDMGISILGDVIAILKHAKAVHSQDVRDKALRDTSTADPVIAPKRSTHQIKQQSSGLLKITTQNDQQEVPVPPKNRKVFPEDEGHYTINLPQGSTAKTKKILAQQRQQAELQRIRAEEEKKRISKNTSVFSRLGKEKTLSSSASDGSQPSITITGLGNVSLPTTTSNHSIFARLGGKSTVKRPATSTVMFDDDEDDDDYSSHNNVLEYAGVLKESPEKKAKLKVAKKLKKTAHKTLAKSKIVVQPETAGVLAGSHLHSGIKSRLGPKSAEVSSTTHSKAVSSVKATEQGAVSRLGAKSLDNITVTLGMSSVAKFSATSSSGAFVGVFSRLGKPK